MQRAPDLHATSRHAVTPHCNPRKGQSIDVRTQIIERMSGDSVPRGSVAGDAAVTDIVMLQRQLAECRASLQALQSEQEVFAHGVSHDLRAPLRVIDGFSAQIESSDSLDATARGHLARVRAASARMGSLIDAMLELSRVNRVEVKSEVVDLGLLAEWVGAELQEAEPDRLASIETNGHLHVLGDERLLKLLVGQLLDNAWKFSRERECVTIRVCGERRDERLHVTVQDEGSGFDMRYAPKLFEPFQRLVGPEQGGGNGLGLAIAHRIVARHDGRLWIESEPGVGSTFHLDLSAAGAPG